jgi:hypothetical protein
VPALNYATPLAADTSPTWVSVPRVITVTGLSVANNGYFYLRWVGDDAGGSGSRDEYGIDNVVVAPLSYHSINFDGTVNTTTEWSSAAEKLGNSSTTYYTTWDDTYLYVGMIGGNTGSDKYNLLIDIDPNDTGAANSGTTTNYCGAVFGADGKPDYAMQKYPGGVAQSQGTGSGWIGWTPTAETTALNGANQVEFRVRWTDIGLSNRSAPIGLYLYACNSSDNVWSAWPPSNRQDSTPGLELTTRTYFPTTDAGRTPRTYAQQRGDQTQFNANGSFSLLNGFAQINITSGGGAGCTFRVDVRGNAAADSANSAVRRLYNLTPTGCTPTANVTLRYLDGTFYEDVNELNGAAEASLNFYHWNGSSWDTLTADARDTTNNTVTRNGMTDFSPLTFGNAGPTSVTLTGLDAQPQSNDLWLGAGLLLGVVLLLIGWQMQRRRA